MRYKYKGYDIDIELIKYVIDDEDVSIDGYDKTIQLEETDFCKLFEIRVESHGDVSRVLLIASYHTPEDHFVAMHEEGMFFMLNDILCIFDPVDLKISRMKTISPMGTMCEVHPYGKDYILYGELEIYRISENMEAIWKFLGVDVFFRCDSDDPAFEMKSDRICLYDFLENYYEIDYDGNLITEIRSNDQ